MIRLFFVGFVVIGGFAAIALLNPRRADPQAGGERTVATERVRVPETVIAGAPPMPARSRERSVPLVAPAALIAPVAAIAQVARVAQELGESLIAATATASDQRDPATTGAGAGGTLTTEIADSDTAVAIEEIVPLAEFGSGHAPEAGVLETRGEFAAHHEDPEPGPAPDPTARPQDADRSAVLIRRMLAVYRGDRADR